MFFHQMKRKKVLKHPIGNTTTFLLFFCVFVSLSMPRMLSLEKHWSSDESLWIRNSSQFMSAVKTGAFSETLIDYHPGVTTMWFAGLRTFWTSPGVNVENLTGGRFFICIIIWAGIGISCFLLYKLFGQWIALASFACLTYSPLFLAHTRRVITDALVTIFILLAVLLFLLYCQNRHRHRHLIFSGITFGLALLSKSSALILLPWIPICLFLFSEKQKRHFGTHVAEGICFLNCAAITVIVLWPVFWTPLFGVMVLCIFGITFALFREMKVSEGCPMWLVCIGLTSLCLVGARAVNSIWLIFEKINWAVTTPHEVEHFFLGQVVNDPGWLFYPFVLSIKSTPLMLPLAILGCLLLWKHRKDSVETSRHFKTGIALVVGILLFTLCLSVTNKKFPRYLLPAFAMLEVLAAIGFVEGLKWSYTTLCSRFGNEALAKYKTGLAVIVCVGFFLIQVMPVLARHPYYGTYYNPCWKVTDITKVITVGDASGLDIAASYLNQRSNASRLSVQVSPLAAEFVWYYFQGHTYSADRHRGHPPDYEVVYIRDAQIKWTPREGTHKGQLEHVITLNGIDHVWIYRIPEK